jgi:DNA (cytosine-5)-methyltransferase 1
VGERKNTPRIWIQGDYLVKAGFDKGTQIRILFFDKQIRILTNPLNPTHRVSGTTAKTAPIIEINNQQINGVFPEQTEVQVTVNLGEIIIQHTKRAIRKLKHVLNGKVGSLFSGGGLLDQSAKQAGLETEWGIEYETKYANIWQKNHSGAMYNMDIAQVEYKDLPDIEYLIGGIPCEPFTQLRDLKKMPDAEDHDNADLSMFMLMVVEHKSPRVIILEEVPLYLESGVGKATLTALKRMGYKIETKILSGLDAGELTVRKRAVIIATTDNEIKWPNFVTKKRTMGEILQSVDDPEVKWDITHEQSPGVFKHWKNQKEAGRNYISQQIVRGSESCQAITKRYFSKQYGNPVVKHPHKIDTYRWLTITEVKRLMGLPDSYDLGTAKTTAGECMGQGILVNLFTKVIGAMI